MSRLGAMLQRASFEGLAFPVTDMRSQGARAVSEHEAWLRDGAELVNGGRKAFRGTLSAAFFDNLEGYGDDLFPGRFEALLVRFFADAEGRLSHPLHGTMTVMVPSWEPRISARVRNGAWIDFDWIEQRASSVGVIALDPDRGDGDPRASLAASAAEADGALAAAGVTGTPPLAASAQTALARTATGSTATGVAQALGAVEDAASLARRALDARPLRVDTAVALWRARLALRRVLVATSRLRAALLPDPSRTRRVEVARTMTLAEFSLAVYGTPFRAADLRAANALASDTVAPGRVLLVLP